MSEENLDRRELLMQAMEAATKNAKEKVDSLTVEYNKARQAAITTELIEIISGVESLK